MYTYEEAKKIGINSCIDALGRDFVTANKDTATAAHGDTEDGVFCFVGVAPGYVSQAEEGTLLLDNTTKFQYRASCNVNKNTGAVSFIERVLPVC